MSKWFQPVAEAGLHSILQTPIQGDFPRYADTSTFGKGNWSEERIGLLKILWGRRYSLSQIAHHLGGVTRCAVAGKLARLGLTRKRAYPRPPKTAFNFARKSSQAKRAAAGASVLPVPDAPPPLNIPLLDLEPHHCRFIPGDDRLFCGRQKREGSSYCGHHHAIVYETRR